MFTDYSWPLDDLYVLDSIDKIDIIYQEELTNFGYGVFVLPGDSLKMRRFLPVIAVDGAGKMLFSKVIFENLSTRIILNICFYYIRYKGIYGK